MNILWVATKPPWPPGDGGRLLLGNTLEALAARGIRPTLVAPIERPHDPAVTSRLRAFCTPHLVPCPRWPGALAAARTLVSGLPLALERHRAAAVRAEVMRLLSVEVFDLVHAEQLQALPQCAPAIERGIPVVLRAQNVESDLWSARALSHPMAALLLRSEARRLERWEGAAVRASAATIALTSHDADRLAALANGTANIRCVTAPFPAELPRTPAPFSGAPAVVVFGSRGWFPNREGARWFVRDVWPEVRRRIPAAVLHLVGVRAGQIVGDGVVAHEPPGDSGRAFPSGAILAVPSRVASGLRMKILEAWARGVPVVSTRQAAIGLAAEPGRELLLADDAAEFAAAILALQRDPDMALALIRAGRAMLKARHDPGAIADRLCDVYEGVRAARGA